VLDLFSVEQPEWRVSEVAEALGLPKSTISELMSELADQRLLSRNVEDGTGWDGGSSS
jgi:DNA-binding IclR family transcriptional regulator